MSAAIRSQESFYNVDDIRGVFQLGKMPQPIDHLRPGVRNRPADALKLARLAVRVVRPLY